MAKIQAASKFAQAPLIASPQSGTAAGATKGTSSLAAPTRASDTFQAERILKQVRMHLTPNLRRVTLRLDPAELGRLKIDLEIKPGKVTAHMLVESPETLAQLDAHLPELRALFEQQGFSVTEFDLQLAQQGDSDAFDDPADKDFQGQQATAGDSADAQAATTQELARLLNKDSALDIIA